MENTLSSNLHVAILCSPGAGNLTPVLVLANRLSGTHNVRSTILLVTSATGVSESNFLKLSTDELVELVHLPPVDVSGLVDPSATVFTKLCFMIREALPVIHSALAAMDPRPDALIVDLFGTEALRFAVELNIPKYVYFTTTAWFAALTAHVPILDSEIKGSYLDEQEPIPIPGCQPVRPEDVVDPMLDRNDQQYHEYVRIGKGLALCDAILLNTWEELEQETLNSFQKPVYPIGPLRRPAEPSNMERGLAAWLDNQPNQSVLFVSFGSGGVLSRSQMIELACGLELSGQRFIWVIRPPTKGRVDDAFFSYNAEAKDVDYLPEGFLERIKKVGLLIPMWAQQVEILNHPSIGGFLTHCGWNSTLESVTSGVPMIAWPLYAEQRMNAALLTEELGVAVRPAVLPAVEVVGSEEVEGMVRKLMEGRDAEEMRNKVEELKMSGTKALAITGSSHKSMFEILSIIRSTKICS